MTRCSWLVPSPSGADGVTLRRLLLVLVTLGLVVLAAAPAVVTFAAGWLRLPELQASGAPPARDPSSIEAWTAFALFYLVWMLGLVVLLVWSYDRLDYHWYYREPRHRPSEKKRRRTRALFGMVRAEDEAVLEVMRRREQRAAERPPSGDGRPAAPGGRASGSGGAG